MAQPFPRASVAARKGRERGVPDIAGVLPVPPDVPEHQRAGGASQPARETPDWRNVTLGRHIARIRVRSAGPPASSATILVWSTTSWTAVHHLFVFGDPRLVLRELHEIGRRRIDLDRAEQIRTGTRACAGPPGSHPWSLRAQADGTGSRSTAGGSPSLPNSTALTSPCCQSFFSFRTASSSSAITCAGRGGGTYRSPPRTRRRFFHNR